MSSKPAIVIVPGAFYEKWHYRHLTSGLEKAGYDVTTIALPSTGGDEPQSSHYPDVETAASAIKSYIAVNKNVVVVMHSYGGLVGSDATKGLLPTDQANGKGVVGLVYLCAGIAVEGMSMMDGAANQYAPWMLPIALDGTSDTTPEPNSGIWLFAKEPGDLFFADCDEATREEAVKRLKYWSEGCMWSKASFSAWQNIESNYLIATEDKGLPPTMQEMITQIPGGRWGLIEKIATGHSPFLSKPEETVGFVRRCCGEVV